MNKYLKGFLKGCKIGAIVVLTIGIVGGCFRAIMFFAGISVYLGWLSLALMVILGFGAIVCFGEWLGERY